MHPADTDFLYIVHTKFDGQATNAESEWNAWYDAHLPKLLSVPGIHTADRYRSLQDPSHYVAIYGIESPDVFQQSRYREIGGSFGSWVSSVSDWRRGVYSKQQSLPTSG